MWLQTQPQCNLAACAVSCDAGNRCLKIIIGKFYYFKSRLFVRRVTPEGPSSQKFAKSAEAKQGRGLEIVFNQQ